MGGGNTLVIVTADHGIIDTTTDRVIELGPTKRLHWMIGRDATCDIVIDDASHASHHQQNAFLELFPALPSGGLYVIEDLRWQPDAFERPGITKTAQLFRGFSETREFHHEDPETEADFRALAPEISGCFVFQVKYTKTRRDQVAVIHKR